MEGRKEKIVCRNKLGIEGGGQLCSPDLKSRIQHFLLLVPFFPMVTGLWGKERRLHTTLHPTPCAGMSGGHGKRVGDCPRDNGSLR